MHGIWNRWHCSLKIVIQTLLHGRGGWCISTRDFITSQPYLLVGFITCFLVMYLLIWVSCRIENVISLIVFNETQKLLQNVNQPHHFQKVFVMWLIHDDNLSIPLKRIIRIPRLQDAMYEAVDTCRLRIMAWLAICALWHYVVLMARLISAAIPNSTALQSFADY